MEACYQWWVSLWYEPVDSKEVELTWLRLRARARLPNKSINALLSDAHETHHFSGHCAADLSALVYGVRLRRAHFGL